MTNTHSAVLPAMLATLRGYWSDARPARRLAYVVGVLLIAVGLAHAIAWLIVGGTAEGPLSFRKPTTFGISFGLTMVALTWISQYLRLSAPVLRITLATLAVSFGYEVAWVSMQHARGVASHFNETTELDDMLFRGGGVAIGVAALIVVFFVVRAFASSTASRSLTLAIRVGLVILLLSMTAGLWMILRGSAFDLPPDTVGLAGSIKLVHAVGMHAIQILPALAWVASFGSFSENRRRDLVALAAVGYLSLLGLTFGLALTGLAPATGGATTAAVAGVSVLCLGTAWVAALASLRRR